jgi:Ricin-type beta-trefoil lectin domain-like
MKCCKTGSVLAAGFIGALTVGGSTAAAASPHHATANAKAATMTNVQILNASRRLCLDAENDARHNPGQNGDKVQLWACLGHANQHWTVHSGPNGVGTITNSASGKCLDAETFDNNHEPGIDGDKVQLYSCNGSANQQWLVGRPGLPGSILNNGTPLDPHALDAENDPLHNPGQNGDKVQMWHYRGTSNQQWIY